MYGEKMISANPSMPSYNHNFTPQSNLPEDIIISFYEGLKAININPYAAQEEAILEFYSKKHVILATPTGSGKSLVAEAVHFLGFHQKKRSFYTCPIKALVSEKFFYLCDRFGAENVGMLTGDVSINHDAPIICCTAEVLANLALSTKDSDKVDYVVMDEFHYYSDKDRGTAWQLPLLCLPKAQFLLMSATIGDCEHIKVSLKKNTQKEVSEVSSLTRPVPLEFIYNETPLFEILAELISSHRYPVYVVNFTQRECALEAQNAMSVNIASKDEKQKIYESCHGFRFDTPFGKDIKRYISHGVGIHHAGLLPKYRLLVEKLAQAGMLKIIMGTDTLGVGINVPIRTVLFTKLYKFDGQKNSILTVRDFKQIAGRAGRKGFDDKGWVIAQAPLHVIENKRAENKISADKKHKKKVVKKEAPTKNYVHYDEATFLKLVNDPPEKLISQFAINHSMILESLASYPNNANQGYKNLLGIIDRCHENDKNKSKLRKKLAQLFKSLISAEIVSLVKNIHYGQRIVANESLQEDFSLFHTLSLYLIEALNVLDKNHVDYALDVLSLTEAILENPRAILNSQLEKKKEEALAAMKLEGLEYDERIEKLDKIEYDKPLKDFIYQTFHDFEKRHPWVEDANIHPKSIVRDMFIKGATFNEYVSELGLAKIEGILLRYISQTFKALVQNVPDNYKNDEVLDIIAYLRTMLSRVDTSLLKEWEGMFTKEAKDISTTSKPFDPKLNHKAFIAKVRAELFHLVKLLQQQNFTEIVSFIVNNEDWSEAKLINTLERFYDQYTIIADARARESRLSQIKQESDNIYHLYHTIIDDKGDNIWHIEASVDIDKIIDESSPILKLINISD